MVKEEKVKIMNKLAMFDETSGKSLLKISQYPKKTYLSTNRLLYFITYSLGYFMLMIFIAFVVGEKTLNSLSYNSLIVGSILVIFLYIFFLIINILYVNKKCKEKHFSATMETKNYYKNIKKLMRMYSNDKKDLSNDEELQGLYELLGEKNDTKL